MGKSETSDFGFRISGIRVFPEVSSFGFGISPCPSKLPPVSTFVILMIVVMLGLDAYYWWETDRFLRSMKHARAWRTILGVFVSLMIVTLLIRILRPSTSRSVGSIIPEPVVAAQYLWHLLLLPIACLLPIVYRLIAGAIRTVAHRKAAPLPAANSIPLSSRRGILKATAVGVPPLLLAGGVAGSIAELGKFRLRKMDLPLADLPRALEGMTIAHLSDFHVGRFMSPQMMRPVIDLTNEMKPDLVLITGDLIDYALADLPPALDELLRLKPPRGFRESIAMCVGNHDIFEDAARFVRTVNQSPVPLLVDSYRTVEVRGHPVQLMGIDWSRRTDSRRDEFEENTAAAVRAAAKFRKPDAFPILLAHHPHAYDEAAAQKFPLTLSGHTHGGQLMATPNLGAGPLMFRYWSGLYEKPRAWNESNGSKLIVSNGIGNWFPLRINAPAEMIHLTLHRV